MRRHHEWFRGMRRWALACASLAIIWLSGAAARADCGGLIPQPGSLNLCKVLVEDVFISPQVPEPECIDPGWKCGVAWLISPAALQCCVPYACALNPACVVVDVADTIAGYVVHAGDLYCDFEEIDPVNLALRFATGEIVNASTQVIDVVTDIAHAHIEMLKCDVARPLPGALKTLIRDLIARQSPQPFQDADIDTVQLVPSDDPTASLYLPGSKSAVTLEDLVIMRRDLYDLLMNTRTSYDAVVNAAGDPQYTRAVNLLIHELVHVRQFRNSGDAEFLRDYLLESTVASHDYNQLSSEIEAYTLGSRNAEAVGGYYCAQLREYYDDKAMDLGDPSIALTCIAPDEKAVLQAIVELGKKRQKELRGAKFMVMSHAP